MFHCDRADSRSPLPLWWAGGVCPPLTADRGDRVRTVWWSRLQQTAHCMSSEHFGQLAWQFQRVSGSCGLTVQAAIACWWAAFRKGLQDLGWTEGRNVKFDTRWTAGDPARMRRYARQRISRDDEVIRRTIRNPARRQVALLPRHEGRRDGGRGVSQEPTPTQRSHRQRLTERRSDGSYLSTGEV